MSAHLVVDQKYHDAVVKSAEKEKRSLKAQTEFLLEQIPEIKQSLEEKNPRDG